MDLEDRRVILTGAASGIGRAAAVRLLAAGCRVALFDVATVPDELKPPPPNGRWWPVDVSDDASVQAGVTSAAAWLDGLDVLLHVAGVMRAQQVDVEQVSLDDWHTVMRVNLLGTFLVVKHCVSHMSGQDSAIVLTSSGAGTYSPSGSFPYGASKGGVHGLALTLEAKLADRGIRVNELAPGVVDTPLARQSIADALAHTGDAALGAAIERRFVDASGVASVLAFLASRDAKTVRGVVRTW